ncbi:MAG: rhomboid family intramembrane serine protease [Candidatus Heimdallarchaeota archaeon]
MPSKYSKTQKHSKSRGLNRDFSLEPDDEFHWLDYKFTLFFTALLTGIYLISSLIFENENILLIASPKMVDLFALNNFLVLTDLGQSYRMISSLLVHANIFHLGGNLLFFVIFSIRLEEMKGWKIAFLMFLIAGLAGNVLTLLIFGANPFFWSLGASGGVNGVFAANLVTMRKKYDKGSLSALAFLIFFASFTIAGPNSNFFAHLGGLIGGGLFMYILDEYFDKEI